MKFLAIDTSGKHLTVIAYHDKAYTTALPDCALEHSVRLMDELDAALSRAGMSAADCDFFAVVTGPGSFTGIRIGIATVKGLCLALDKPALAVTSFDCIAYDKAEFPLLCLVDAGHGYVYACGYGKGGETALEPRYLSGAEAEKTAREGGYALAASEGVCADCPRVDVANGFLNAVLRKAGEARPAQELTALYVRKSSAEENRT